MVFWLTSMLVFCVGAAVGSFLNVLIYRTIRGRDWVKGRSRCEHCRKHIPWYENIPLLSYLILRGRCSGCKKPIDIIHPAIELLTGVLFVWWYMAGYLFFTLTSAPLQIIQPVFLAFGGSGQRCYLDQRCEVLADSSMGSGIFNRRHAAV